MNHIIENELLSITINDSGAELSSIFDKKNNRELLWQADPNYWKRHAPILFPNVGKHYKNTYKLGENTYPSSQHGFARDSGFSCVNKTKDSITHLLTASEKTKEIYPFDFELYVTHTLTNRTLTVKWEVRNLGKDTMFFTIGAHPAFNVPIIENTSYNDYFLSFDDQTELSYILLNKEYGTAIMDKEYSLSLNNGKCQLNTHMFDNDALVFNNSQIRRAAICLPDGTPYIEMIAEDFPNFGIWSVPGASFVCLEPWMGRCDDTGYTGDLSQKENINILEPNDLFTKEYTITAL